MAALGGRLPSSPCESFARMKTARASTYLHTVV